MQEYDFIETPENVELQRKLAGIGTRFLAGFIDSFIIAVIFLCLFIIAVLANLNPFSNSKDSIVRGIIIAAFIIVAFLVYWGYFVFFEMIMNGQSPGKKYMKIRVVQQHGSGITFTSIAIRNLIRIVDSIGGYGVAGISMFLTPKVQRLGDLAAGTVVISEEMPNYASKYDKKAKVFDDQSITAEMLEDTGLTPHEFKILSNYWLRKDELTIDARSRILPKLLKPISERHGKTFQIGTLASMESYVHEIIQKTQGSGSSIKREIESESL